MKNTTPKEKKVAPLFIDISDGKNTKAMQYLVSGRTYGTPFEILAAACLMRTTEKNKIRIIFEGDKAAYKCSDAIGDLYQTIALRVSDSINADEMIIRARRAAAAEKKARKKK